METLETSNIQIPRFGQINGGIDDYLARMWELGLWVATQTDYFNGNIFQWGTLYREQLQ